MNGELSRMGRDQLEAEVIRLRAENDRWVARIKKLERHAEAAATLLRGGVPWPICMAQELGNDLRRSVAGQHIIGTGGGLLKKYAALFGPWG